MSSIDRKDRIPSPSRSNDRENVVDHDAPHGMCSVARQLRLLIMSQVTDDVPARANGQEHGYGKNHMIIVQPLKRSEMQARQYLALYKSPCVTVTFLLAFICTRPWHWGGTSALFCDTYFFLLHLHRSRMVFMGHSCKVLAHVLGSLVPFLAALYQTHSGPYSKVCSILQCSMFMI